MSITSSLHRWTTRWQSLPTQHGFVLSTYVWRLPSINFLIQYSLTVWFDRTFSSKTSLGITFCLLQLSPKMQSWGSLSAFCTIPKISHQLVKPSSLGASLGGKLCRIMVKPYLAGGSPSPGWAVSPPQGTWPSSTTNNDPCDGCLLGRS